MKTEKLLLNKRLYGRHRPKLTYHFASSFSRNAPANTSSSKLFALPLIKISSPCSTVSSSTVSTENRPKQELVTHEQIDGKQMDGEEEVDRLPQHLHVQYFDLLCYFFSIFTYLADILLDVFVAWMHYSNQRYWSCIFISSLVVFPSLVLNIVAAIWWIDDELARQRNCRKKDRKETNHTEDKFKFVHHNSSQSHSRTLILRLIMCVLQLAPVLWYVEAIKSARNYQKELKKGVNKRDCALALQHYCQMVEAERDASLLRFFEAFIESVPQLLVQGFLVAQDFWRISSLAGHTKNQIIPSWVFVQMVSMGCSLLSASWSIVAQHRSLRVASPNKANMSYRDSMLQFYWHLFTLTSRYICLVMFTLAFKEWILVVVAVHYCVSLMHVSALQAIATQTSFVCMEVGLLMINAAIHIFTPFNMAEGSTKLQYTVAYTIEFLEGMVLMGLCLWKQSFDYPYKYQIATVALICFVVGISIMLIYYAFFHPSRESTNTRRKEIITTTIENTITAFEMNDDW